MDTKEHLFARMETERKFSGDFDIDVDFHLSESGQASDEHADDSDNLDDMDFSMLVSGRNLGNTDRSMATGNDTPDTNFADETSGFVDSSTINSRSTGKQSDRSREASSNVDSQSNNKIQSTDQKRHHHQQQQQQSFQPLPDHATRQRSAPRAIPNSKPSAAQTQQSTSAGFLASQPSSAGSTASAFLNNLLDPAASTFNMTHFSHTPPNQIATSYEASHFGKRARSGVSTIKATLGS